MGCVCVYILGYKAMLLMESVDDAQKNKLI